MAMSDPERIPVLLYHAVSEEPPRWLAPWNVRPDVFRRHLEVIVDAGCSPLTLSALVELLRSRRQLPPRPVTVSFDDGFADLLATAAPLMAERGIVGTAYLSTGLLRGSPPRKSYLPAAPMMAWADVPELEELGIEVGAHSHSHPELDTLRSSDVWEEVLRPKQLLEERLGHRVRSYAYPHGYSNARVRQYVAEAGYDSAAAVRNSFTSPMDNPYAVARLTVRSDTPFEHVRSWIVGQNGPPMSSRERMRTQVWRGARRLRHRVVEARTKRRGSHGAQPAPPALELPGEPDPRLKGPTMERAAAAPRRSGRPRSSSVVRSSE